MLKLIHANDMKFNNVEVYVNFFDDKWRDLNCYALSLVPAGIERYIDALVYEKNLFFLVDDSNEDDIIGFGTIEDSNILNYHEDFLNKGNIGYGIRPDMRCKNYGTQLLRLLLNECEKRGMKEVCVSCHEDNLGSKGVIENNNGKFEKKFFDEDSGKIGLKYWIKLKPKLQVKIKRLIKKGIYYC
jgi:RimJ/RimL family protein N-acetyltransferase